jgi:hypothetical protein
MGDELQIEEDLVPKPSVEKVKNCMFCPANI